MAIVHLSYVICDICGLPGSEPVEGARSARFHAEGAGFTSESRSHFPGGATRRVDFCPDHRPASSEGDHV